jgi:para-nitrobenzyl esterase
MSEIITETRSGKVRGRSDDGIAVFKGLPYGAPPVGERRFKPPAPESPWSGVRDAFEFGPSCPQPNRRPTGWTLEAEQGEDCLVLNVWSPAVGDGRKRPVMVWFHGGGFTIGSGSWPLYESTALSRRGDVVVVTVNHRLGPLGYLHLGESSDDPELASSGNAGMLDLVASLEWVRDHIAEFGGDPDNVTIFGESGGGAKVCTLLVMPSARGLFHRAIVQSGPSLRVGNAARAGQAAEEFMASLDLRPDQLDELRALPAERLLAAQPATDTAAGRRGFRPILDGISVTAHPQEALADGTAQDLPLMIGCTRDEATLQLANEPFLRDPSLLTEEALLQRLRMLGDRRDALVGAYRRTRPGASPLDLLIAIQSDMFMRTNSIQLAESKLAGPGTSPTYMYLFRWAAGAMRSSHGFEIPFVFDNVRPPILNDSPSRTQLAERMSEAWISFARSGDPVHDELPDWPPYTLPERATMIFDRGECGVENDPAGDDRRAWQPAEVA